MIDPSFQGANRRFALSFENVNDRIVHTEYIIPTVEIKDYNIMIDGQTFLDQPVKNDLKAYDFIRTISTGQGDD